MFPSAYSYLLDLVNRSMGSLPEVARMPNGSKITDVLHGGPAPRSSVDCHGINNGVYDKQSRECDNSAFAGGEKISVSNPAFHGSKVSADRTRNSNSNIDVQRHKAGSVGLPTAAFDLPRPVADSKRRCNGYLLKIQDEFNAESHSLTLNTSDNTLDGPIPHAFNLLHNPGSADKAQVKYMCMTQMQSCHNLCIGDGCQIPRWCNGAEISYVICTESFETPGAAALVATAMTEAISMWGKVIGVVVKEVDRYAPATFQIKYKQSHNSYPNVYAKSFLPTELASSLVIYQKALDNSSYLANILAHEFGHILGLRHEFALKTERFLPSVRFGSENCQSIMNYFDHPSKFQVGKQDREELAAFYAYGLTKYRELPIIEIPPQLHKFGKCRGCNKKTSALVYGLISFFLLMTFSTGIVCSNSSID